MADCKGLYGLILVQKAIGENFLLFLLCSSSFRFKYLKVLFYVLEAS